MCVGLRYTLTERDLFSSRVSRDGMVPSCPRGSSMNWRYGSDALRRVKKA